MQTQQKGTLLKYKISGAPRRGKKKKENVLFSSDKSWKRSTSFICLLED